MRIVLSLVFLSCSLLSAQAQKKMADGKRWTTRNLNVNVTPSYCYEDADLNCQKYGRLYTWESAPPACRALGRGWRLPTEDEWRKLAKSYGGVSADAEDRGKAAYKALLTEDRRRSGFHAVLGGGRSEKGEYARIEAHGFYWTASESSPANIGWSYNFGKGGQALHRQDGIEKTQALSVRCVKD